MAQKKSYYYLLRNFITNWLVDEKMSKELVKVATKIRDQIPELEGLMICKLDGTKLWGDTLKDLNHDFILSSASLTIRAIKKISESVEKKEIKLVDIELEDGFVTIVVLAKALVVGFFGEDARSQLGVIKKNLRAFASKIDDLI